MGTYKIIRCAKCGQQLRIPSDKEIQVSCPKCKYSFRANVKEKREKTFVEEAYSEKRDYTKECMFVANSRLNIFMQQQIVENKAARHFYTMLYYPTTNTNTDEPMRLPFELYGSGMNWTVVKELMEEEIRKYNLGIKSFSIEFRHEPCERKIKEGKKDFWGRPKYKNIRDTRHTIWISASW